MLTKIAKLNDAPVHPSNHRPVESGPFLPPAQLAERHHKSVQTLANERSAGKGVSYIKLGRKVLYPLAAVEAYEARGLVEVAA